MYIYHLLQSVLSLQQSVFTSVFENSRKATISLIMSLRPSVYVFPHGNSRLPLGGFSRNLIFGHFLKIFRQNASWIKKSYMNNGGTLHENLCRSVIISRWIMLKIRNVLGQKLQRKWKHVFSVQFIFDFPSKFCRLWVNVGKIWLSPAGDWGKNTDTLIILNIYQFYSNKNGNANAP